VQELLRLHYGFEHFRPEQELAIDFILQFCLLKFNVRSVEQKEMFRATILMGWVRLE